MGGTRRGAGARADDGRGLPRRQRRGWRRLGRCHADGERHCRACGAGRACAAGSGRRFPDLRAAVGLSEAQRARRRGRARQDGRRRPRQCVADHRCQGRGHLSQPGAAAPHGPASGPAYLAGGAVRRRAGIGAGVLPPEPGGRALRAARRSALHPLGRTGRTQRTLAAGVGAPARGAAQRRRGQAHHLAGGRRHPRAAARDRDDRRAGGDAGLLRRAAAGPAGGDGRRPHRPYQHHAQPLAGPALRAGPTAQPARRPLARCRRLREGHHPHGRHARAQARRRPAARGRPRLPCTVDLSRPGPGRRHLHPRARRSQHGGQPRRGAGGSRRAHLAAVPVGAVRHRHGRCRRADHAQQRRLRAHVRGGGRQGAEVGR